MGFPAGRPAYRITDILEKPIYRLVCKYQISILVKIISVKISNMRYRQKQNIGYRQMTKYWTSDKISGRNIGKISVIGWGKISDIGYWLGSNRYKISNIGKNQPICHPYLIMLPLLLMQKVINLNLGFQDPLMHPYPSKTTPLSVISHSVI